MMITRDDLLQKAKELREDGEQYDALVDMTIDSVMKIAAAIHYPDCWDAATYTLWDAVLLCLRIDGHKCCECEK